MNATLQLKLDPMLLETPAMSPLFRLASRASAVAGLVVDQPVPAIPPGWYLFDAAFTAGDDVPTQIVVDYGDGFAWLERLSPCTPDRGGRLRRVVTIKSEPRELGLLTGPNGRLPLLELATLRPIGRLRAWLEMVQGIHVSAVNRGLAVTFATLGTFARTFLRHGRRVAADELMERYQASSRGVANDYDAWLTANTDNRWVPAREATSLLIGAAPIVSVLMVLHRHEAEQAMHSVNSVLAQTSSEWQLCVCHDRSAISGLPAELVKLAQRDPRITLVPTDLLMDGDGWMAALLAAKGDYCARLQSGDRIAPHAVDTMADALKQRPSAGFLYSDHDMIDAAGRRSSPAFKPDWSPDLACQRDVLLQLALVQRSVLLAMDRHAGADAYDMALRACDALGPDCIVHVPQVLYHCLQSAVDAGADAVTDTRAMDAFDAHLARIGQAGLVQPVAAGLYRVVYPLPTPEPSVEVLVPTRDQRKLLARCVDGVLERTEYANLRLRIIDNDSRDPDVLRLLDKLAKHPRVIVERAPGAFNFSRIINRAARHAQAQVLCLLNDDVVPEDPGWLREMVSHALRPEIGAVGALLKFPDGSVQHAGVVTGVGGVAAHVHYRLHRDAIASSPQLATTHNYSALTAACMVVTREKFEQVGGLDESLPVCYNDVDFCLRLRAQGYFNVWTPFASLLHHESATRGPDDTPLKRARHQREFMRMLSRWGDRLNRDPAYNPNLSLYGEPFDLAHSPRATNQFQPAYPTHFEALPWSEAEPCTAMLN